MRAIIARATKKYIWVLPSFSFGHGIVEINGGVDALDGLDVPVGLVQVFPGVRIALFTANGHQRSRRLRPHPLEAAHGGVVVVLAQRHMHLPRKTV